jgi:23S rRNA U2552 (ribose-2'-O)-methylase RlmE/FtsJ
MKSYRLVTKPDLIPTENRKKYRFKALDVIKEELSTAKSKLDTEYEKKRFGTFWSSFDPFKNERQTVAEIGCTLNVSNAWLKCYEILNYYKLLPDKPHNKFLHFDNAAFPGSFVISTHHLVKTRYKWGPLYNWKASSLLAANELNASPLEDKYGLYSAFKQNWLMSDSNNGDVLIEANQRDFCKQIGGQVDLYTSDLGFDVSSDYNNQESLQLPANIGQIISGLVTLRKGGAFITKQYTTFEPSTVSVMYAVSQFFDEFYICKPITSRMANSETYLVGKGFKGGAYFEHPYIKALLDRINKKTPVEIPIFDAKDYPKEFLINVVKAMRELANSQTEKINADIERVNRCLRSSYRGNPAQEPIVLEFIKSEEPTIQKWYEDNPVMPIDKSDVISMKNALGQR